MNANAVPAAGVIYSLPFQNREHTICAMRMGVIGGGGISDTHARAALSVPGIEIAAVYGVNSDKTARLAREYGGTPYGDFGRFLAHQPMDFVAIGSPSGLHGEQAIAAAQRGLHVLVEKPLEISTARADALIREIVAANVKLGVFFQDRLRPAVRDIKRAIDSGQLGAPVMISGRVKWYRPPEYYGGSRWRGTWALDGGGALMNQAIHTIDLMLWLFGRVRRVYGAAATRVHRIEVEDTATAVLEFDSGALGTIEAGTSIYPGYDRRLEVTGTCGTMILEHDRLTRTDLQSARTDVSTAVERDTTASASSPIVSDASAHARVIDDFVRAIRTDGTPACDAPEGRRSVALVEAIYKSAKKHQAVPVE
jgi:UDP-N-acetyl-2-amino-2-deoxyglucuronate dehydrogenase